MTVTCNDRDRILRDAEPPELAALEGHAASCPACALELREWNELSGAAREMRDSWDTPSLWPRIHEALTAEAVRKCSTWNIFDLWSSLLLHWQAVAATVLLLALTASGAWLLWRGNPPAPPPAADGRLLNGDALAEVERAEAAYIQAIDKLAAQAQPRIENPATPLLASYREKLLVLDAAIADLRANIDENRSNRHLRTELQSMLREKKETLEAILEEEAR